MDPKTRRQSLILAGLALALAYVVVTRVFPSAPASTSPGSVPARGQAGGAASQASMPGLGLDRLDAERIAPDTTFRNPFRFGSGRPAPIDAQEPSASASPPQVAHVPPVPSGPPPPPPIPFKFIGIVSGEVGKLAVLSDGHGVYHGREGEIVEGQYRIVRIGEESVQIEYADGRGRQTIRLSGS